MAEGRLAYLVQKWRDESAAPFFYHLGHADAGLLVAEVERLRSVALAARALVQTAHDSHHDGHTTVDEPALTALESALEAAGYGMSEEEAASG